MSPELAPCASPDYARSALHFNGDADVEDLRRRLSALGEDVYRAKGFVPVAGRLLSFDYSLAGLEVSACPAAAGQAKLALIVKGSAEQRVCAALSGVAHARLEKD